jgi:hypothetical protein
MIVSSIVTERSFIYRNTWQINAAATITVVHRAMEDAVEVLRRMAISQVKLK